MWIYIFKIKIDREKLRSSIRRKNQFVKCLGDINRSLWFLVTKYTFGNHIVLFCNTWLFCNSLHRCIFIFKTNMLYCFFFFFNWTKLSESYIFGIVSAYYKVITKNSVRALSIHQVWKSNICEYIIRVCILIFF